MKKVLILEDEVNIRSFVVINLQRAGYTVVEAGTGQEALDRIQEQPDIKVAILDIMLPDIDGFEVCRRIRAGNKQMGIIMLTARTQEMDKVTGLMTGADDYVTKPFSVVELVARVEALFRRVGGAAFKEDDSLRSGPFKLNKRAREVTKNSLRLYLHAALEGHAQVEAGLAVDAPVCTLLSPPMRRYRASIRAVSSAGEKGLVT